MNKSLDYVEKAIERLSQTATERFDEIMRLRRVNAELVEAMRAIELRVDGLETKAYPQKLNTQTALDAIKAHCRAALRAAGVEP